MILSVNHLLTSMQVALNPDILTWEKEMAADQLIGRAYRLGLAYGAEKPKVSVVYEHIVVEDGEPYDIIHVIGTLRCTERVASAS